MRGQTKHMFLNVNRIGQENRNILNFFRENRNIYELGGIKSIKIQKVEAYQYLAITVETC